MKPPIEGMTSRGRCDSVRNHVAGDAVVGRGAIVPQKSRVDISFFTAFLDNLDNIRWNTARFVEGAPRYMLECEG